MMGRQLFLNSKTEGKKKTNTHSPSCLPNNLKMGQKPWGDAVGGLVFGLGV